MLFEQAVSYTSWTLPSMVALLAARYPTRAVYDRVLKTSLVEALADEGFATAALTDGGFASHVFGLDRGFEFFHEGRGPVQIRVDGEAVQGVGLGGGHRTFEMAARWLASHRDERFFLLVHSYEIHAPYNRRELTGPLAPGRIGPTFRLDDLLAVRSGELPIGPTEIAYLEALYDGGVATADRWVGELVASLEPLGLADTTLIVVTSDHGEEFGRRFPGRAGDHGHSLYDELVRVPLIFADPARSYPVKRVRAQVRTIDIMPTILERLGVAPPAGGDGARLLPLMEGRERSDRIAISRLARHGPPRTAVRHRGHKWIFNTGPDRTVPPLRANAPPTEFYALDGDPAERRSLADEHATVRRLAARGDVATAVSEMEAALRRYGERLDREGEPDFTLHAVGETPLEDQLKALGYVE